MKRAATNRWIGWLDLGEEGQRRANEYLSQFKADNTMDELGFGILRDAFSDIFFPATNTIMTRTRYLIFIPAICHLIEQERLNGKAAAFRLKELEDRLRESLLKQESEGGVIGSVAVGALRRYPSNIYWSALRRLGVFLHPDWGLGFYQDHLSDFYSAMTAEKDDDGLSHLGSSERRNWDQTFCGIMAEGRSIALTKGIWPETLSFSLTRPEAQYLKAKYLALAGREGQPSLLSYLLEQKHPLPFRYPWEVPVPKDLEPYVMHSRCFSIFVQGATLQYFHLLLQKRKKAQTDSPECELTELFSRWWEITRMELSRWPVDEFLKLASQLKGLRRDNDASFIKAWVKYSIEASNALEMWNNPEAHELISRRERITRPNKSRLHHNDYLQRWTSPEQARIDSMCDDPDSLRFRLDYRSWIGNIFVSDIVKGLEGRS